MKLQEFIDLKQKNLTIVEYEVKFDHLSQYAHFMIATEQAKCIKFERGLRFEMKNRISADDMQSFDEQ